MGLQLPLKQAFTAVKTLTGDKAHKFNKIDERK
jgi:hypothetical protein